MVVKPTPRGDDQERHRPAGHRQGEAPGGRRSSPPARAASSTTASARRWTSRKGDKVLYAKYAGTEFKIDDDDLLIVSQKDILAIVDD